MSRIEELLKQKEAIEKKIRLVKAKESADERKQRARKLIELGGFFFGLDYAAIHKLIEDKEKPSPLAIELQKKVADYLKLKNVIMDSDPQKNERDKNKNI